ANGLRVRHVNGHSEDFLCKVVDTLYLRTAAGEEQTRSEEIEAVQRVDLALDQLERLAHAAMNDRVQHLTFDFLAGEAGLVTKGHGFTGKRIAESRAALLDFDALRL